MAAIGDPFLVEQALKDGANVNDPGARGERALCAAAKHGHGNVLKILLENGADPNGCAVSGSRGETPLHHLGYAAYNNARGVTEAVQLLLRRGADPKICDNDGVDAIGRMKFWNRHDLARLMETHVAQFSEARVDLLITLDAVGQRLSVDLEFVQQLVKEGRLEAVELKKDVLRVSEASLRRYVNALKRVGGYNSDFPGGVYLARTTIAGLEAEIHNIEKQSVDKALLIIDGRKFDRGSHIDFNNILKDRKWLSIVLVLEGPIESDGIDITNQF
jgi:hypothetical protein